MYCIFHNRAGCVPTVKAKSKAGLAHVQHREGGSMPKLAGMYSLGNMIVDLPEKSVMKLKEGGRFAGGRGR
jgi:hypothetical protein